MSRIKVDINRDPSPSSKDFKMRDLISISMLQIKILQIISHYSKPVIRHTLYLELKGILQTKKETDTQQLFSESFDKKVNGKHNLSTSTFYSNLNDLEQKGLLAFNKNKKGKITTIRTTQLTESFLTHLNQYFLLNLIKDDEFDVLASEKIIEKIENYHFKQENSILSVWIHENPELSLIEYFSKNFNNVYNLSTADIKEKLIKSDLQDLDFTRIRDGSIREPNNAFDLTIMQGYNENLKFYGLSQNEILKELVRVTKPGGVIFIHVRIFLSKTGPSLIDRVITNEIISLYNDSINRQGKALTKNQLKNAMKEVDLEKLQIFEEQGILIGIGEVPKLN